VIGLDTNVLVRLITDDDPAQAGKAARFLDQNCSPARPAFINCVVLVKLEWVLRSAYRYDRALIADAFDQLLGARDRRVESEPEVRKAVLAYRSGSDFADALIAGINSANECEGTITFDQRAPADAGFVVLR
jgi:predicted nucleic-acid-binding protein